jgi:gamma-glutamyltranspeptidase/glutathione hydrolase
MVQSDRTASDKGKGGAGVTEAYRIQNWQVRKPAVRSRHGVVASQSQRAARVGAGVLERGGNAVDAAVTTAFALNACEPWMSGVGGGGYMLVYVAREDRVHLVDFPMLAPQGLNPADYPLVEGESPPGLFPWRPVRDNVNNTGYLSMAVPGNVDGLGLALETFGTLSWAEALAPAVRLAGEGMPIDWWVSLNVTTTADELALFPDSRGIYLADGLPPMSPPGTSQERIRFGKLAATLDHLAKAGRREFYEGDLARSIADDIAAGGGSLSLADLKDYRAAVIEPLAHRYRDVDLSLAPGLSGGPTMARALRDMERDIAPGGGLEPEHFTAYARALLNAYEERLATMGAGDDGSSCTTQVTVADRDGNVVSLTQTLLARFGSKVVLPGSNILMNNGIAWFDTEPGRPNSLEPGRRPLANMSPVIARRNGGVWFALGASGGRRIVPAVTQLTSLLIDCGLDLETAFHQPRIDVSGPDGITYDPRLGGEVGAALAAIAPAEAGELAVLPALYACPNGIQVEADGEVAAANDVMSPHSGAVAAQS